MRFDDLRQKNEERCDKMFGGPSSWGPTDWTNALAGEVGEACNITKKMKRLSGTDEQRAWNKEADQKMSELLARLGLEIGDVVIYADLLATSLGLRLEDCVRASFNLKSQEIRSDVMIGETDGR